VLPTSRGEAQATVFLKNPLIRFHCFIGTNMRNTLDSPYRKYFLTLTLIMLVRGITLGQLFTIDDVAAQDKEIVERYIKDVQTLEPVSLEIAKKFKTGQRITKIRMPAIKCLII
jgi:hypothetical protein